MLLRVQYPDSGYDYVDATALSRLISSRRIKKFFRPLENSWVDIEEGPVREETIVYTDNVYIGPERRRLSPIS
jgi:hypothetical protein